MLMEERLKLIAQLVAERGSIRVSDLTSLLHSSESTIRRDIIELDRRGKVKKIHGGATVPDDNHFEGREFEMGEKYNLHLDEKKNLGRYAATLVEPHDLVYLDAGTTTEMMIDFLHQPDAVYVTNGVVHAVRLAQKGWKCILVGGVMKSTTEAIVGSEAIEFLKQYNFTKGFFGVNGISTAAGYSTPDAVEALVKREAIRRTRQAYVLADPSKFNKVTPITFAALNRAEIITTECAPGVQYRDYTVVTEVNKL